MKHRNAIVFFSLVTCLNLGSAAARAEEGLTLEGAIARSLADNPSVQSKGHAVAVAKGRLKEALAPTDARLGAQVSMGQNVAPIDEDDLSNNYSSYGILVDGQVSRSLNSSLWVEKLFSFGLSAKLSLVADRGNDEASIAEGSIPPQYEYQADPAARTYSGADLELSLPILKAFEDSLNGNNIDAATYYLEQQRSELEDLVSRTILEVADAYWEYTIAYMYYGNLLESAARLKERERNLVSMVTAGVAPKTEMIRMQASLAKKNTDIILAKASARSALTALAQLMGSSSQEAEAYAAPADLFPDDLAFAGKGEVRDTLDDAFIRGAIMNRADIKALRNQASAAETQMRIAQIDSRPDLNIFGNAGYRGTTYDDSGAGYFKAFTENVRGLNYSVGIYFRAALPNNKTGTYDSAAAQYAQAKLALEGQIRGASLETRQAHESLRDYFAALKNALEVVKLHASLLEGEQKRFDAGLITVGDLYDLEELYVSAKSQFYSSYRSYLQTALRLKYFVGSLVGIDDGSRSKFSVENLYRMPELSN